MPVAMTTTNFGRASGSTEEHFNPVRSTLYVKNSEMPVYWMPACTSAVCRMLKTFQLFGLNANVRRILMSKEQVRFVCDLWHDLMLLVRKPKQPSLLAEGVSWCSNVPWVPRLEAYQQTEDWISIKHTNHENQN